MKKKPLKTLLFIILGLIVLAFIIQVFSGAAGTINPGAQIEKAKQKTQEPTP